MGQTNESLRANKNLFTATKFKKYKLYVTGDVVAHKPNVGIPTCRNDFEILDSMPYYWIDWKFKTYKQYHGVMHPRFQKYVKKKMWKRIQRLKAKNRNLTDENDVSF